jgi:sulfatase maturation enzyme AslB (radical SAM superfamily)
MEILKKYNVNNNVGMQSNGSLLTDDFYKLLQEYDIHYSISHDGIQNEETRGHTKEIEN